MAYEWMFGGSALSSGEVVDQRVSKRLSTAFADYQASLRLRGKRGFGPLTARTYDDYLLRTYLRPAATRYLTALPAADRTAYLDKNAWITWSGGSAAFAWEDFLAHVGRKKNAPAFDSFALSAPENNLAPLIAPMRPSPAWTARLPAPAAGRAGGLRGRGRGW
ncbi:hypothetical protein ACWGMA_11500 [Streptomyces asiaticus]